MTLEAQLKKTMGYTDDDSRRCRSCTYVGDESVDTTGRDVATCMANKASYFQVDPDLGRCDHFSAKRPRRQSVDRAPPPPEDHGAFDANTGAPFDPDPVED